jgi:hypothetical protein
MLMWIVEHMTMVDPDGDDHYWVEVGSYSTEAEADTVKAFLELHNPSERYRKRRA